MVKKQTTILLLTLTMITMHSKIPHSIVLTLLEYPFLQDIKAIESDHEIEMVINPKNKGEQANHLRKNKYKKRTVNLAGIPIIYFGYITHSRSDGIVMFPKMHIDPEMFFLVSNQIRPVFMLRNTVHHLEIEKNSAYAFFKIEKKYDKQTETYIWIITKEKLPEHNQIPLETIILFTEPESVYIPEGASLTNETGQTILPPFYIKDDTSHIKNNLASLEINYIFKTIDPIKNPNL